MIWPLSASYLPSALLCNLVGEIEAKPKKPHIRLLICPHFMFRVPGEPVHWWECKIPGTYLPSYGRSPKDAYDQWVKAGGSLWPPTIECR